MILSGIWFRMKIIGWVMAIFVAMMPITEKTFFEFSGKYYSKGIGLAAAEEVSIELWPHEQSDLAPDSNLVFGKLPNGFRYVLMKNKTPLDRVSMHLMVQAGSLNEADDQQGYAHFLEHLLFCGTTHFKPGRTDPLFSEHRNGFRGRCQCPDRIHDYGL